MEEIESERVVVSEQVCCPSSYAAGGRLGAVFLDVPFGLGCVGVNQRFMFVFDGLSPDSSLSLFVFNHATMQPCNHALHATITLGPRALMILIP